MSKWRHTLRLADVFHDETRALNERARIIADRIEALPLGPMDHLDASALADELRTQTDADEFDTVWDEFYDFADWARIWVETR